MDCINDPREMSLELRSSLLDFTSFFFKLRTGNDFKIAQPVAREPHIKTICTALNKVFYGECPRLIINCPPGYGKTELAIHVMAMSLAINPKARNLYISYSHTLAALNTEVVRQIVSMPIFKQLFGVELSKSTSAKDHFQTTDGGMVYASGAMGTITGLGAGRQDEDLFSGLILIDDIHKPEEVFSDTIRGATNRWFKSTLLSRRRHPTTPIVFIGQRLHEDDLSAKLMEKYDGHEWEVVKLTALDNGGNALCPYLHDPKELKIMADTMPYEFSSQYQQEPQPAGGGIFKKDWFKFLDQEPNMISTFIVVDGAETDKTYNDATVFTHFGVYKAINKGIDTGLLAIHCINCNELFIEPKDIESEFLQFYTAASRHPQPPVHCFIETKSAGTTLVSVIKNHPGLGVVDIKRGAYSGCKTARFYSIQRYVARGQITFPVYAKHTTMCVEHLSKITANDTHRRDDICDTFADAGTLALIDKLPILCNTGNREPAKNVTAIARANARLPHVKAGHGWH